MFVNVVQTRRVDLGQSPIKQCLPKNLISCETVSSQRSSQDEQHTHVDNLVEDGACSASSFEKREPNEVFDPDDYSELYNSRFNGYVYHIDVLPAAVTYRFPELRFSNPFEPLFGHKVPRTSPPSRNWSYNYGPFPEKSVHTPYIYKTMFCKYRKYMRGNGPRPKGFDAFIKKLSDFDAMSFFFYIERRFEKTGLQSIYPKYHRSSFKEHCRSSKEHKPMTCQNDDEITPCDFRCPPEPVRPFNPLSESTLLSARERVKRMQDALSAALNTDTLADEISSQYDDYQKPKTFDYNFHYEQKEIDDASSRVIEDHLPTPEPDPLSGPMANSLLDLSPVLFFLYKVHNANCKMDYIVACTELFVHYYRNSDSSKSFFRVNRDKIISYVEIILSHNKRAPKRIIGGRMEAQSLQDISGFFENIWANVNSPFVRASIHILCFAVAGVTCAVTGASLDWNDFSKESINTIRTFGISHSTTTTISKLYHACNIAFTGFSRLIKGDMFKLTDGGPKALGDLLDSGSSIISRGDFNVSLTDYKDLNRLGADLDSYSAQFDQYNRTKSMWGSGKSIFGVSLDVDSYMQKQTALLLKQNDLVKAINLKWTRMCAAAEMRVAPYACCIHGGTSLGKTSVLTHLAVLSAKWSGLSAEEKYRYVFNPATTHLDGYKSWQHTFIVDDVGAMRPAFQPTGDPQVTGAIPWINNVPHLTNQADLADKKTTPFWSRFVFLTTNVKDINAQTYMSVAPAVLRRVKYFIGINVHPDFVSHGVLDADKAVLWMNDHPSEYPPFWTYTVEEYVATNTQVANAVDITGRYEVMQFEVDGAVIQMRDVSQDVFIPWFYRSQMSHFKVQDAVLKSFRDTSNVPVCPECGMPKGIPHCAGCSLTPTFDPQVSLCCTSDVQECEADVCHYFNGTVIILTILSYFVVTISVFLMMISAVAAYIITYQPTLFESLLVRYVRYRLRVKFRDTMRTYYCKFLSLSTRTQVCTRNVLCSFGSSGCSFANWVGARETAAMRVNAKLGAFFIGLAALATICTFVTFKKDTKEDDMEPHGNVSYGGPSDVPVLSTGPKWGEGRLVPIEPSELKTIFNHSISCSAGTSHDGVKQLLYKSVFRCAASGFDRDGNCVNAYFNGFVLKQGYISVNTHSLISFNPDRPIFIKLFFSPTSYSIRKDALTEGGDVCRKPSDFHHSTYILSRQSIPIHNKDITIIHDPTITRKGVSEYIVGKGHTNCSAEPSLYIRSDNGVVIEKPLSFTTRNPGSEIISNKANQPVTLIDSVRFKTLGLKTESGDSGSLVVIHTGKSSFMGNEKKGMLAVVAMHVAGNEDGFTTASLIDKETIDTYCGKLAEIVIGARGSLPEETFRAWADSNNMAQSYTDDNVLNLDIVSKSAGYDLSNGLQVPHRKAPVNWISDVGVNMPVILYGCVPGAARSKQGIDSSYRLSLFSDVFDRKGTLDILVNGREVKHPIINVYAPAVIQANLQYVIQRDSLLDSIGGNHFGVPSELLDLSVKCYFTNIVDRINSLGNPKLAWSHMGMISYIESINGIPGKLSGGVRLFDGINKNTGAGFGYSKPKHHFMVEIPKPAGYEDYDYGVCYDFVDDIPDRIRECIKKLESGIDPGFVYTCHFKDEVRTKEKVKAHKIRTINGSPIELIVICRMYLLRMVHFMQQYPLVFECAVGINTESRQWGDLLRHLMAFGDDDRWIAGDYGNFDKNQTLPISMASARFMYMLCCHAHSHYGIYTDTEMVVVRTLLIGMTFPIVDHFGTLFQFYGTNPSGHPLTAQRNCISNGIYTRSVFLFLCSKYFGSLSTETHMSWYDKVVRQMHYGDDIVAAVRKCCPWFNHDAIAHVLSLWGVPFTHANKCSKRGIKYINVFKDTEAVIDGKTEVVGQATFLKRRWEYNEELKDYMCPIEFDTIVKMAHYKEMRTHIGVDSANMQLMAAMVDQLYSQGRETYDKVLPFFQECARTTISNNEIHKLDCVWGPWDIYRDRFIANSASSNYRFIPEPPMPEIPEVSDPGSVFTLQSDVEQICGVNLDTIAYLPIGSRLGSNMREFLRHAILLADEGPEDGTVLVRSFRGRPIVSDLDFDSTTLFVCDTTDRSAGRRLKLPGPASSAGFQVDNRTITRLSKNTRDFKLVLFIIEHCRWTVGVFKPL